MEDYPLIRSASELALTEGQKVSIIGRVTDIQRQHVVLYFPSHPFSCLFDFSDSQIVAYLKEEIDPNSDWLLKGTVVRASGSRGDPSRKEAPDEYHLLVDSADRL